MKTNLSNPGCQMTPHFKEKEANSMGGKFYDISNYAKFKTLSFNIKP